MTLQATTPIPSPSKDEYRFVKYTFFKVHQGWQHLSREEGDASKRDFLSKLKTYEGKLTLRSYSTVGTRGDTDFLFWTITDSLETLQNFHSEILRTELGKYLSTPHSYLAMMRPSEYFGKAPDPDPIGSKFLFVYPFTKKREWYSLPFEERRRMMKDHVQIGHKYTSVTIHTSYSFGLDDYEFILSFETDYPQDFLNLVMDLRSSEASKYTAVETPIFTCVSVNPDKMLDLLGP